MKILSVEKHKTIFYIHISEKILVEIVHTLKYLQITKDFIHRYSLHLVKSKRDFVDNGPSSSVFTTSISQHK